MSYELLAISLFINFYGHVRADASAEGAGGALASILKEDEMVSLLVELFRQADALLRTGHDTELTAFTTFLINRNLSHSILSHQKNELDADCRRFSG
jgi:hypothetical protein